MALNRYFTNRRNLIKCAVVGLSLSSSLFGGWREKRNSPKQYNFELNYVYVKLVFSSI